MANVRGQGAVGAGSGPTMWRRLTEPARSISDPETRRQARLLSAVLLVLLPASMAALLLGRMALAGQEPEQTLLSAGGLVIVTALFVAWRLARTRHVTFAAWLALVSLTAVPVSGVVLRAMTMTSSDTIDIAMLTSALSWTLLPTLLSNMVMTMRSTAIFVAVLCGSIVLMPVFLEAMQFTDVVDPLGLIIAVSALVMVAGGIRNEDRHRIHAQNAELSRSEQRFRGLFDGTTVATCVHDAEMNIIDVNSAFERLFGYTFDGACELSVGSLVSEDDREALAATVSERSEEPLEITGCRRDGSSFILEATSNTHISRGEKIQLLELRDVSELREAQGQAIQARTAAEEAAHAQSEFLVHVGRTLRPPLSNAISVVNTLAANRARNLRDEDLAFLKRLEDHHTALDNKIKDVLLLSQLETGRLGITPSTAMLDRICGEVMDGARGMMRRQLLTLSLVKPDLVAPVMIDVARLRQILKYLLAHAITASDSGFVTITIAVDPETHVPCSIAVADASAGMSAEDQAKVFQPLDVALRTDDERLGLTICRALVQLMGFHMRVESAIMEGTTFTIDLLGLQPAKLGVHSTYPVPGATVAPPQSEEGAEGDEAASEVLVVGGQPLADLLSESFGEDDVTVITSGPHEDLGTALGSAHAVVCEVIAETDEQQAFGALEALLIEPTRPPITCVTRQDSRLSVLGPIDTIAWPPDGDAYDGVLSRYVSQGPRRILVITADEAAAEASVIALNRRNCEVSMAINAASGTQALRASQFDLFIVDAQFPLSDDAMTLMSEMRRDRRYLGIPFVLGVSAGGRMSAARRLHLIAESVERPADKALTELQRTVSESIKRHKKHGLTS